MNELPRRDFLTRTAGTAAIALLPSRLPTLAPVPDPVAVGVVGCGRRGREILGELAKFEQVRITAVCDVDERRRKAARRRAREASAWPDMAAMLAAVPELQAVFVATPTHLHREPAVAALEAGKHVYVEAPLASTREDLQALAAAAGAARGRCAVGLTSRSNPVYRLARSFVLSGTLDRNVAMEAVWNRKIPWGQPGSGDGGPGDHGWRLNPAVSLGLEGELASLQFDTLHWFQKREQPVRLRGHGSLRYYEDGRRVPDTVHLVVEHASGLVATWQGSLASSIGGQYEQIRGSNATVRLADTFGWMFKEAEAPVQGWEVYAARERFHNDEGIILIADATKLAAQGRLKEGIGLPEPPLYYALQDFLKSVLEDQPVAADVAAGVRAALLGIHAHGAVAEGGELTLAPEDLALQEG